ncbi:molybdate transport system permease protein [Peptoniphilus asaccharolyticus DSM 20463]|uniref:Molybdenum transport system permease n=1 Tax=Peptoniphilus asaccharolyticus DSM 20463 TaxID=573058 RepID=A0A1W1VAU2_PEPAS|nr:molybdate ABC transporter permease subunit [Peptoniphilus asaccharolyticus]MBL7575700.1 molybdate ABC transporter permease subunit [Peptoniphilus asaccharolyticus]SMB90478.1 molybdate transport system permease protein [Peptoniphilus asaccharolyticus DSM 20463]
MELVSNSILFATVASIFTFILAIIAAKVVIERKSKILDILFTLPMVLPPTVVGFLLLIVLGNNGIFGKVYNTLGVQILFTPIANIIAATVVSFPIMYKGAYSTFKSVDEDLILVAKTLGLSEMKIFRKITLPLSKYGLVSSLILSFSRALGEFGATMMVSGNIKGRTQTLSTAIYAAVQAGNYKQAYSLVALVIVLSTVLMFLTIFFMEIIYHNKCNINKLIANQLC